ncbi:chaplin [Streptomyces sp. Ag109_O5-1]|uniref:chaplin n=1 Tax=Streptomyces sp. Ag109_O5-1 TaxID=1938851 RepID=UPI000F4FADB1|nr:chaplin [Streptomyces sp. Ag109_O5-1]
MRPTLSRGMFAAAAATSILSLYGSPAFADADATGATGGSPGVLSGNNVQAPVNVPVNICGNSVDAAAALNPAFGNSCANESHEHRHADSRSHEMPYGDHENPGYGDSGHGGPGYDNPGYGDSDHGHGTPPSYGDTAPPPYGDKSSPPCTDTPPPSSTPPGHTSPPRATHPPTSPPPTTRPPTSPPPVRSSPPPSQTPPGHTPPPGGGQHAGPPPTLPHTGSDREAMLVTSAASAVLIAGGTILYRRGRAATRRS